MDLCRSGSGSVGPTDASGMVGDNRSSSSGIGGNVSGVIVASVSMGSGVGRAIIEVGNYFISASL